MPLYEYECSACRRRFELIQKFSDPLVKVCPSCGGTVQKLPSSPAIQFKGSGWYVTDYSDKGKAARSDESTPKREATEGKTDGKTESSPASQSASSEPPASKPAGSTSTSS